MRWVKQLLRKFFFIFALSFSGFLSAQEVSTLALLDTSILSLEQVERNLQESEKIIQTLNEQILILQESLKHSESDTRAILEQLKASLASLEAYQARVEQLGKRYEELLKLSQKLRDGYKLSVTINAVVIPVAVLALGTLVYVLAKK